MKYTNLLSILILCLFLLSSCTTNNQLTDTRDGYPISENPTFSAEILFDDASSAYPGEETEKSPTTELPKDLDIPAPSSETAVVYGTLLSLSEENAPYIAPSLFLGSILTSEGNNDVFLGSISIDDDPMAQQASNGKFVFQDIPPGEYGLFIWTPVSAFIVKDESHAEPVLIEVEPGQTYDLGTIYVP